MQEQAQECGYSTESNTRILALALAILEWVKLSERLIDQNVCEQNDVAVDPGGVVFGHIDTAM
jgi:hypothetical protein